MVVGHLLTGGGGEEVLEGDEVLDASYGEDPVHHAVVLLHGQPAIAQKDRPAGTIDTRWRNSVRNMYHRV